MRRRELAGGCFVLSDVTGLGPGVHTLISRQLGAKHLSQYLLVQDENPPPILSFGEAEIVLFLVLGSARAIVAGRPFAMDAESAVAVRPGEAFQLVPTGGRVMTLVTVCPEAAGTELAEMPRTFDEAYPARLASPNPKKKEAMGERFYQVLVSRAEGSTQLTQFIGEIPKSKAPTHHHNYEEAIYVLSGEGVMWTGAVNAPLANGALIYLPKGQPHSLEATSEQGLRVAGHFYPAGSPAENY